MQIAMHTVQLNSVKSENASLPPYIGPTALFKSINFNQCRHPNSCRTDIDFRFSLVISQLTEAYTPFCRRYELNVVLFPS